MSILIVDDQPAIRKLLRSLLEIEGHTVFTAGDGVEAIELLPTIKCDVIISDILMPRMDGYRFCQEVRRDERFHLIPFIIYTSTYTSPSDEKLSLDLGADKFLRKPASAREIFGALIEVVNSDRCKRPRQIRALPELEVLKEYSERLVVKLEQKNAHLADVTKQLELQSTALKTAANAILITDSEGTITWVNPAFTETTGYTPEEAIGQTPRILKSGVHNDAFYRAFWKALRAGKTWRGEFTNRCKDGSIRHDEHIVTPVRDGDGVITHFVGIMHDVTARKLAEQRLKEQAEALARSNAELLQFNRLAVGRELRAIEVKNEVNELCQRLGEPHRYDLSFGTPEPLERDRSALPAASARTLPANRRILVIDDNISIHDDFRKILAGQGGFAEWETALFGEEETERVCFEIDCAARGEEGLAFVRQAESEGKPYGLAFVDIRMAPGWDGVETAKRIWDEYPDLQIVLCTAYSDYSWAELRKSLGRPDQFLILKKPFDVIEVVQFAHTLLEKWRLGRESRNKLADLESAVTERTREIEASRIAALNMRSDAVEARAALERTNQDLEQQIIKGEHAAAALRGAEEKYRSIFQNSAEGIFQTTPDGKFLEANPAMARILGFTSPEELIRERTDIANQGYVNPVQRPEFQRLVTEKGAVENFEYEVYRKDRSKAWISENAHAVRNERGEIVRYEGSFSDITERKRLEQQLRQAQKMEAVGQLAGGIAHDFNNLLMVINGYSNMLLDSGHLAPQDVETLKEVYLAGERAANLTRQLLTFSRRQPVQMQVTDLDSAVRNVTKMLQRIIGEDVRLEVRNSETGTPIVADVGMIEQVLMNFAVNARDAMPKGGQLSIQLASTEIREASERSHPKARPGKFASLTVKDTGCGMSPEVLSHIFEPFFTTKAIGKGTGMGLATVFGIIEQHQGWIEVETAVDAGTAFTVFLPLAPAAVAKSTNVGETQPARGGQELILMVEDDEPVRALALIILKKRGYRVLEAATGPEALEVWQRHGGKIDLLLTDMVMPGEMTGRELTEKLKASKPDLKVVYTSGYSPDLMRQTFGLMSNVPFLQKPYTPSHLVNAVRECLDAHQETPGRA